jgi:hypothetical protein
LCIAIAIKEVLYFIALLFRDGKHIKEEVH